MSKNDPAGALPDDPLCDSSENSDQPDPRRDEIPEIGGPAGPEPTRYGDWEKAGRCSDF